MHAVQVFEDDDDDDARTSSRPHISWVVFHVVTPFCKTSLRALPIMIVAFGWLVHGHGRGRRVARGAAGWGVRAAVLAGFACLGAVAA